MNEELKNVLTLFREKRRVLDIVKTPEIFIQQSSSADEVEQWLKAKGFSDRVVKKLHGLNGNELFALKRHTLEDYCGSEEGRRLASQITIQRNISGVRFVNVTTIFVHFHFNSLILFSIKRLDHQNFKLFWLRLVRRRMQMWPRMLRSIYSIGYV